MGGTEGHRQFTTTFKAFAFTHSHVVTTDPGGVVWSELNSVRARNLNRTQNKRPESI